MTANIATKKAKKQNWYGIMYGKRRTYKNTTRNKLFIKITYHNFDICLFYTNKWLIKNRGLFLSLLNLTEKESELKCRFATKGEKGL